LTSCHRLSVQSAFTWVARFQRFCDVRLGLSKGEAEIDEAVKRDVGTGDALRNWTDARVKSAELNFVEAEMISRFENPEAAQPAGAPRFDELHRIRLEGANRPTQTGNRS
jgi:hypothetical protein